MAYNSYSNTSSADGCPTLQPCPACGGLNCLCRPRFYAGQRLTEQDLNNLENYVVAKNKLHNRYLNDWGVVCGLEVVCNPCGSNVHVKTGYALSPCGNDIIVCNEDTVDICKLINACAPVSTPDCLTNPQTGNDNCTDLTEDWILSICYDEKQARSSPSLAGSTSAASGSGCCCSGTSTCGCGCNSTTAKTASNTRQSRPVQAPNCEPTLICEGYVYRVTKASPKFQRQNAYPGALAAKFQACLTSLQQQIPPLPNPQQSTPQLQYQWCCSFKQALRNLMLSEGTYDCLLAEKLACIQCPDPNSEGFVTAWYGAVLELLSVFWDFVQYCLCSALLPPCPDPVTADCVPLATITVRRRDCKIVKVCNWGPRKIALTLPNLGYWLSFLSPFAQYINKAIENFCCNPVDFRARNRLFMASLTATPASTAAMNANIANNPAIVAASATATATSTANNSIMPPEHELTSLLYQAITDPDRSFDAEALLALNTIGVNNALSDLENRNPAHFLMLTQVIGPLINSAIPSAAGILANLVASTTAGTDAAATQNAEIAQLKSIVADLTQKVDKLSTKNPNS